MNGLEVASSEIFSSTSSDARMAVAHSATVLLQGGLHECIEHDRGRPGADEMAPLAQAKL